MEFESESDRFWLILIDFELKRVRRVIIRGSRIYNRLEIFRKKRKMPLARERSFPGTLSLRKYMRDTANFLQIPSIWFQNMAS